MLSAKKKCKPPLASQGATINKGGLFAALADEPETRLTAVHSGSGLFELLVFQRVRVRVSLNENISRLTT